MKKLALCILFIPCLVCFSLGVDGVDRPQSEGRPLKITKKPKASGAYCRESDLEVKLRVTLHKSGKVTAVEVAESSGCKRFDKNASNAAKKIEFVPATKNGEPVTIIKEFIYRFTLVG